MDFPGYAGEGEMLFQCKGKKTSLFLVCLWLHIALLVVHSMFSILAMIWWWKFRAITNLLRTLEDMDEKNASVEIKFCSFQYCTSNQL